MRICSAVASGGRTPRAHARISPAGELAVTSTTGQGSRRSSAEGSSSAASCQRITSGRSSAARATILLSPLEAVPTTAKPGRLSTKEERPARPSAEEDTVKTEIKSGSALPRRPFIRRDFKGDWSPAAQEAGGDRLTHTVRAEMGLYIIRIGDRLACQRD